MLFRKGSKGPAGGGKSGAPVGGVGLRTDKGEKPKVNILENVKIAPQPKIAKPGRRGKAAGGADQEFKPSRLRFFVISIGRRRKGLESALKAQGFKESLYEFVRRMMMASLMLSVVFGLATAVFLNKAGLPVAQTVLFAVLLSAASFYVGLNTFLNFPVQKGKANAKNVEKDILFAARDIIISLRSGMPLFNAIASVSTGYGEASKQFTKIVERVQVGMQLEQAIDEQINESESPSFRRIMIQASVSIKAGADVVEAIQSVVNQLAQEQVIALRRYGQRLNALAMFYMLFGVILPSMGIAVITILTTFISFFTVDASTLLVGAIFIGFLQVIFLQLIRSGRPVFAM